MASFRVENTYVIEGRGNRLADVVSLDSGLTSAFYRRVVLPNIA